MSKGTNDKLNETLDMMGTQNTAAPQSSTTGKTSSDRGFYLIMLIIILAAAFYIYQDASKRYGRGISNSATVQSPADQLLPAEHPQLNSAVPEPQVVQPVTVIETETVIIPEQPETSALQAAEEETLKLKDAVSNKVSHMVDKVKNLVGMGGDNAETTLNDVQSESKTATAPVYNTPANSTAAKVSLEDSATVQPQQENMPVATKQAMSVSTAQPDINTETTLTTSEDSATGFKEKVNKMVDKVKGLVHLDNDKQLETEQAGALQMNSETQSANMDTQLPMPSQYDSGYRGYQGYLPPPSYNARPDAYQRDYNSYQARNQYQQPDYGPNSYSQQGPQYQVNPYYQPEPQYQPRQNRYNNPYQGYGSPYPDYPQYRQGPAY